jgi:tetratricopeptide (TPR) repeat protein
LFRVVQAKLGLGEPTAAISLARQALTIAEEIENPWGRVNGQIHLALGFLESGHYEPALTWVQQAVALAQAHQLTIAFFCIAPLVLGRAYRALGRLELARQTHLEAEQFNARLASRPFSGPIASALCADCALMGAWEEASAWARKAIETRSISLDYHSGLTFWYEVEALVRAGEVERAVAEVRRFGERIGANPRYRIPYLRSLAVLSLIPAPEAEQFAASLAQLPGQAAGARAALAHLEEANHLAEEIGLPGEQASILAALAALYRSNGREAKAREAMIRGAEIGQTLALRIEDNELRTRFIEHA